MGGLLLITLGTSFLLSIPITTALLARRMGRSAKKWFLIGLLLPGIATFIVFFLPDLSERRNKR